MLTSTDNRPRSRGRIGDKGCVVGDGGPPPRKPFPWRTIVADAVIIVTVVMAILAIATLSGCTAWAQAQQSALSAAEATTDILKEQKAISEALRSARFRLEEIGEGTSKTDDIFEQVEATNATVESIVKPIHDLVTQVASQPSPEAATAELLRVLAGIAGAIILGGGVVAGNRRGIAAGLTKGFAEGVVHTAGPIEAARLPALESQLKAKGIDVIVFNKTLAGGLHRANGAGAIIADRVST
jgi:hypothetical protein